MFKIKTKKQRKETEKWIQGFRDQADFIQATKGWDISQKFRKSIRSLIDQFHKQIEIYDKEQEKKKNK